MSTLDQIRKPISSELKEFDQIFKLAIKSNIPLLNIITSYLVRHKGKQMRPIFVFLTAKMLGTINKSTFTAASLVEMLHTATLIHDDVVDESYERRGVFSINALWKSKIAVLLGDFLLAKGLLVSLENKEYELLHIVSDAVKEMSEGEILHIKNSQKIQISEAEYFDVISKKTASLIASCTACGAQSVRASETDIAKMKLFGKYTGIAFQLKDDLFDYEKKDLLGKPVGNDIKEKKLTLPLLYALEKSSFTERTKIISSIKKNNKNKEKVQQIINFAKEKGGIEYTQLKMNEYISNALKILDEFPKNDAHDALRELLHYTINRKK